MKMDKTFFAPEVRSGYFVSSEIKKLWAIQLDLLQTFDVFCKEYNITYYAQGGTLLGAVRHNGFIPWDDDIDVIMLWDDYKKMLKKAPDYFKYPYFLQNYLTENEAEPTLSKLRRIDTTGATKWELECITPEYNKGIFIDIFPLFNVPDDNEERIKQREEIYYWWRLYKGYEIHRERSLNGVSRINEEYKEYEKLYLESKPLMSFSEIKQKYVAACSKIDYRTKLVAPLSFRANNPKTTWPREWFDKVEYITFENLTIPCIADCTKMLDHQFGEWRIPIINASMHEMGIFDADISYMEKLKDVYVRDYFSSDYNELLAILSEVYGSNISKDDLEEYYIGPFKHILVAVKKKKVVGCAFLRIKYDYIRDSQTSFVTYLAVSPFYRRNGIASKLMEEIEKRTKAYGCSAVELTSADFRTEAHEFYRKKGFNRKKTTVFIKELEQDREF